MTADRNPGASLDGKLVVLIGGSGFLGTHLAQHLLARGARLRIASRHPERAYRLRALANLGQIQFVRVDVTKAASVAAAMAGADAAVYMVGAFKGDLQALQADGAGLAAKAAAAAGAQAFAYVSAIGANPESEIAYARTKGDGERQVLAAFPGASVLRPSVLFGEDDHFLNMFAGLIASLPALPVFGAQAQLQPLWVDDAAEAIAAALADPAAHGGKTYEIAGPEPLTMGALNRMIAAAAHRRPLFIELPDAASALFAALPLTPMSSGQWKLLKAGSVPSGALPGMKALGIVPRPIELFLDKWMTRYRRNGRFGTGISAAR
jgi:NADH dehydrogenase